MKSSLKVVAKHAAWWYPIYGATRCTYVNRKLLMLWTVIGYFGSLV